MTLTPGINTLLCCVKVWVSDFVISCIALFHWMLMSDIPKIDLLTLYLKVIYLFYFNIRCKRIQ